MVFTHDTELALQAAVHLANSGLEPDTLTEREELDAFCTEYRYSGRRDHDDSELDGVRAIRGRLYALLTADRDAAVEHVNDLLRENRALPQLQRHDEFDWHLHAVSTEEPLHVRILVEAAMAMVDVIRADEMTRLSTCADDGCEGIVLDLSRNRSRRFCSTACGNRNAVAAYRARQAEQTGEQTGGS
ncbi:CGNR zinc finger domain-containing protein [Nocardioides sp.]|uniref:CGNR zinc finger domain-containing protein n=1 Tax=Nocardioides sp. TaxID=35761 RepID=UPI003514A7C2